MSSERPEGLMSLTTYLLSQAAKIAKRELDARLAERGMRLRHMAVLSAVDDGPATQQDLGQRLHLDPSDVTATVDDLEAGRLVRRSIDPADRRRKVVTVTAKGRRELAELHGVAEDLADRLLEPIPQRRRRQLHEDMRRVLAAHDERSRDR